MQSLFRDVAQSGLEYSSGGRVVAGSNPVILTDFQATVVIYAVAFLFPLFLLAGVAGNWEMMGDLPANYRKSFCRRDFPDFFEEKCCLFKQYLSNFKIFLFAGQLDGPVFDFNRVISMNNTKPLGIYRRGRGRYIGCYPGLHVFIFDLSPG